jgi:site-specific DNA-cytosine methylase
MNILIACEESQVVCEAFRKKGHNAYSCDLQECSGGHPEWHLQHDIAIELEKEWDMIIAFPPCTYLTCTGNKWFKPEFKERFPTREADRAEAIDFFMKIVNAKSKKIAIENPVGVMSSRYRKPDQIVHPFHFGDKARKRTCFWLKNLPKLVPTNIVEPEYKLYNSKRGGKSKYPLMWAGKHSSIERSKTFQGIADAMADQWGKII